MRYLFTIGDGNGIFRWSFYGDKDIPSDMSKYFEELEVKPKKEPHKQDPTFNQEDLLKMTYA